MGRAKACESYRWAHSFWTVTQLRQSRCSCGKLALQNSTSLRAGIIGVWGLYFWAQQVPDKT